MDRIAIIYILRLILLIALQVLVLNNVLFSGILNPYVYIYFLLVLPVDFSPNLGLFLGFLIGFCIDILSQTIGMHTIATVFTAYCRPYVMRYMAPRDGYEFSRIPGIRQMGWLWFITYVGIMILLHHFVLFFVEAFRMTGFWITLLKSIGSGALTLMIVLIIQMLFARTNRSAN